MSVPQHNFEESIEMYLKTISELSGKYDPVPIAALAERLGISNVSANEMIHRLKDRALITHTPYKGVALTESGLQRAQQVIRRHHLWECFLVNKLGISWQQAHDFACRMEHTTDREVIDALAAFLDHPETCPHGNQIPYNGDTIPEPQDTPLSDLAVGQRGTIARIHPESTLVLEYLAARELKPSLSVEVVEIAPFNGPITIQTAQQSHTLGREVATYIYLLVEKEKENS